ncbi:GntR family transcriptional regulator [Salsuginibacillus kocurii]|uniref:GntR family transcriptional regulator n=1 Tax=Salsuginibacillus kocurii TaxID=427078 RepID=UPI000382884E|nr:GntR family transcriptional regulator [Salsuginibacillus kocurii]
MTPKYKTVKQHLKSKILDGSYQPYQKISSEHKLMEQFKVSRHTIRQAIGELVSEGWLYREHGAGTFCADRSHNNSTSAPKNIALITTYISDYIFPHLIRGAESYLSERGYNVILFSTNNDFNKERMALENILSQKVDGIIVEPTKSAFTNPNINYYLNLENLGIPYVMINAYYEELEPPSIIMDDEKGAYLSTDHLLSQGHENVVGIFKTDDLQGVKRMKGFVKAHRKHRLNIHPENLITYATEEKDSKPSEKINKLLDNKTGRPTGIVCYNDELVIQVLKVIRGLNLKVPENISIIGFDNSHFTEATEIKFTSVAHPKMKMGEKAAEMIVDMVENSKMNDNATNSIVYEPELVVRTSSSPLKSSEETI